MELHLRYALKFQAALSYFIEQEGKVIRTEPLGRAQAHAIGVQDRLSDVHEVELMAELMQEPADACGISSEVGLEHIRMHTGDNPLMAEMVFLQLHEQDDSRLFAIVCEG